MQISEIWIYPIKSVGGIALTEATPEIRGLKHDRRWMLVNDQGRFLSQREIPGLALLRTAINDAELLVCHKDTPSEVLQIPLAVPTGELLPTRVEIWGDKCTAELLTPDVHEWFSNALGEKVRLVLMPESTHRWADGRYAPKGQHVSFADGFPYLIIGQASLDDLNKRLAQPLPMNRFRPNFVYTGGQPFEEDEWSDFKIGSVAFRGVKPCARCSITTTDQETAERAAEPLKTLATFRNAGKKILFGQNVVWMGEGSQVVRVGDAVSRPVETI